MSARILATYRVAAADADIRARAEALAAEQSVEMPVDAIEDRRVLDEVLATVEDIRPAVPAGPAPVPQLTPGRFRNRPRFDVTLGIAVETTGCEASQLVNMLFGNCSLQPEVELVDVVFPAGYHKHFPGPRFGIDGIRTLAGAQGRALTCTALKPQGSPVEHLARLAHTFALAGIDVIKDDHGIANQAAAPFAERVPAVMQAILEANRETGGRTLYAPTFSGGPAMIRDQARIARECGVRMALVAPMLIGLPAFVELEVELDIPLLAHPAFAGATRIAPPLLLGKLFRLFGADATIFPNHGGRFSYDRGTCLAIAAAAREPWNGLRPALPVPAGGMTLERLDGMRADYGADTLFLIGGALLSAKGKLLERSRQFVAAVRGG